MAFYRKLDRFSQIQLISGMRALADGNIITGSVFNDMIGELGLEVGNKAVAIVKSTDLMIGVD